MFKPRSKQHHWRIYTALTNNNLLQHNFTAQNSQFPCVLLKLVCLAVYQVAGMIENAHSVHLPFGTLGLQLHLKSKIHLGEFYLINVWSTNNFTVAALVLLHYCRGYSSEWPHAALLPDSNGIFRRILLEGCLVFAREFKSLIMQQPKQSQLSEWTSCVQPCKCDGPQKKWSPKNTALLRARKSYRRFELCANKIS